MIGLRPGTSRYLVEYNYVHMFVEVAQGMGEKDRAIQAIFRECGVPETGTEVRVSKIVEPLRYEVKNGDYVLELIK